MARPWEINGDDIHVWSQRVEASAVLPDLVRRLLLATTPIGAIDMRADGGTRLPGWDGIVQSSRGSGFCPRGQSVWELSTRKDVHRKLNEDFDERTKTPAPGALPAASTYVAVTGRRFAAKQEWAGERRAQRRWLDVRVMDADDLAAWLSQAPAVARWFAGHVGKPEVDALDLDNFLARWRSRTSPPLPIEVVLAGRSRERAAELTRTWARSGRKQPLFLKGDTKEEAVVFAAAALALAPGAEGEVWRARTLVVESEQTLRWACRTATGEPLIVLPAFDAVEAKHAERGALVVVPMDAAGPAGGVRPLVLEPIPYLRVAEILIEKGFPRDQAERHAASSGGKLAALQRLFGYAALPMWASAQDPLPLSAMLLVGAYQPENEADREVLRALGAEPGEVERMCERLRLVPEAPIAREQERWGRAIWRWGAEEDAWKTLAGSIPAESLRRLSEVAVATLGKDDPRFTLAPDERFAAQVHGKVLEESEALREGMARALVRLALADEDLGALHGPRRGSTLADGVVRRLLEPGWRRWASLSDLLPLLAEAAPEVFLDRLEVSLGAGEEGAAHLLAEEGRFGSPHTGLLWALEALGWSEAYFARVADALARLAEHDPISAEERGDRPAESLNRLLRVSSPQATAEQRIHAVERLTRIAPEAAFRVLVRQLGEIGFGFVMDIPPREPRLRVVPRSELRDPPGAEISEYAELAMACAGSDARRWAHLIRRADMRAPSYGERILARLESVQSSIQDDAGEVWGAIRHVLSLSRDGDIWQRWNKLYVARTPSDPVMACLWLFAPNPELPEPYQESLDVLKEEEKWSPRRAQAIEDIGRREDWLPTLSRLAEKATDPYPALLLGASLAQASFARELDTLLIDGEPPPAFQHLLGTYLGFRVGQEGTGWLEEKLRGLLDAGEHERVVALLGLIHGDARIWDLVDELGVEVRRSYWRSRGIIVGERPAGEWDRVIRNMLDAGNVTGAARSAREAGEQADPEVIALALRALAESASDLVRLKQDGSSTFLLERLMDRLEREPDAGARYVDALAKAELAHALSTFEPRRSQRRLSSWFAADAERMASFVQQAYQRVDASDTESAAREQALMAARILDVWKGYPGEGLPEGERDELLLRWSKDVLDRCGRGGVALEGAIEIAKVLARAPEGQDGHWPCTAARRLLESGNYPDLRSDLDIAKRNQRGWVSRAIGEGGKQERDLAAGFRASAKALRNEWPRTAVMLDGLADSYEHDAEHEDARAQADLRRAGAEAEDFHEPPARPSPSPKRRAVSSGIVRLDTIEMTDFTLFERLALSLEPPAQRGQWIILLGENGRGKSSLIRAMVLALGGAALAQVALGTFEAPLIRFGRASAACVVTSGGDRYAVSITNDGTGEVASAEPANGARPRVIAYGCRRGSALGGNDSVDLATLFSDAATVFSESARLYPAKSWLKDLKLRALQDPKQDAVLSTVTKTLCRLLPGVERLDVVGDQVFAMAPELGGRVPLGALSDGYLTTLGWVADLVARWLHWAEQVGESTEGEFFARMEGLVLIDEIDLHLHPRWQRTIVRSLKDVFPRLSFVVSTHNPLTLLGADAGEIVVLGQGEHGPEAKQLDLPRGIRADRILTGRWFGLEHTVDDETIGLIERHQAMLLRGVAEDAPERRSVEEDLAQRYGSYADTSIDRMALEVAAELMREQRPKSAEERSDLRRKLRDRVAERLRRTGTKG